MDLAQPAHQTHNVRNMRYTPERNRRDKVETKSLSWNNKGAMAHGYFYVNRAIALMLWLDAGDVKQSS
ncbi:hypothetical protein ENKO_20580 [Enterobacter kobei]|jgi:hypothetical protein|uniref:Uncharacterized protein n=1 Tax=Enterobacter kobei TaxID=208224 RepID=A0AA86J922_9ENTR|nr:hypothetical protein ENKO_20580 [Enterobacter kobei]